MYFCPIKSNFHRPESAKGKWRDGQALKLFTVAEHQTVNNETHKTPGFGGEKVTARNAMARGCTMSILVHIFHNLVAA